MNSYWKLTKTFLAAIGMSKPQDKRRKVVMSILALVCVLGVLLPTTVGVGILVEVMTDAFMPLGCATAGIQVMLQVICIFTVVFGILVIFNELYFSNDIEYLLPWPLRAWQIVASKFTAAFINENIMQCLLVLSCIVGFGIGARIGILNWILSVIGIVTLPIIPLAYCAIAGMLLMGFTRLIRNKDMIQRVTVLCLFLILLNFVGSISTMKNMDIIAYVSQVANGQENGFAVLNYVFPHVLLFVKMIGEGSLIATIEYFALHAVVLAVMLVTAELLYFRGVIGLTSSGGTEKKVSLEKIVASSRQHCAAWSYFMKEVRILVRTPAFFTNCVGINFVWPVFVYAMYKLQNTNSSLQRLRDLYVIGDERLQMGILVGVMGISVLITAINSISSGSISREGKNFSFMKYIPVPYAVQWHVKALVGIVFPVAGMLIYMLPFLIVMKFPVLHILYLTMICVLSITFVAYMGIYVDSIQPKLIWDDEMNSLRENYNTFFAMGLALVFVLVVCGGGCLMVYLFHPAMWIMRTIIAVIVIGANVLAQGLSARSCERNIAQQEET